MKGILLVNLGSPDDLNLSSIKRYLKEFLSDDFVVDLPKIVQQILVNCKKKFILNIKKIS